MHPQATRKLDLSYHHLTKVPNSVYKLRDLLQLHVAGNKLKTIPHDISKCTALAELDASGNR